MAEENILILLAFIYVMHRWIKFLFDKTVFVILTHCLNLKMPWFVKFSRFNPAHHSSKVDKWSSMQITGVIRMRSLKTEVCYKWYKSHVSFWKSGGLDHSFEQNFPLNLYALLCTSWHPPPWRSLNSHNSASLDL